MTDNIQDQVAKFRRWMVETQLQPRDIVDPRVLKVFLEVPRHEFISSVDVREAYADHPIPIGLGQTISQPYMVALMTQCLGLKGGERVLEIGTGSGYQAAVLSRLARRVYSVERFPALVDRAAETLKRLGYDNVEIRVGDGTWGWPEHAPYDGIMVTAGAPEVPPPLLRQLAEGGRLVIPVGGDFTQSLMVMERKGEQITQRHVCGCVFVPLIGEHGWKR